jgi:hypothetical protein
MRCFVILESLWLIVHKLLNPKVLWTNQSQRPIMKKGWLKEIVCVYVCVGFLSHICVQRNDVGNENGVISTIKMYLRTPSIIAVWQILPDKQTQTSTSQTHTHTIIHMKVESFHKVWNTEFFSTPPCKTKSVVQCHIQSSNKNGELKVCSTSTAIVIDSWSCCQNKNVITRWVFIW